MVLLNCTYTKSGNYKNISLIKRHQQAQLKRIMRQAYKIDLYKNKFDECGLKPNDFSSFDCLKKFPLLTKTELKEYMDAYISDNEKRVKRNYYINSSSGSSGIPIKVIYSIKEKAFANAEWIKILGMHGYNPLKDITLAIKVNYVVKNTDEQKSIDKSVDLSVFEQNCTGEYIRRAIYE